MIEPSAPRTTNSIYHHSVSFVISEAAKLETAVEHDVTGIEAPGRLSISEADLTLSGGTYPLSR